MWRILTSSKLALWLIALMAIEMGIAMFIPQVELNDPNFRDWAMKNQGLVPLTNYLKLNLFFTSPIFLITVSFFWLNTLCCTYNQLIKAWNIFSKPSICGGKFIKTKVNQPNAKELIKSIKAVLEKFRFRVKVGKDNNQIIILAIRNRWSLWGMPIFHIAILWTIFGAAWGELNRVEGNGFVVEGFSMSEQHQGYTNLQEGLLFREKHAGFEVKIHEIGLKYRGKIAPLLDNVILSINEDGQEVIKDTLIPNQLIEYQGYKIKLYRRGFSPILQVDDGSGPRYSSLSLDVHPEVSGGESYKQTEFIVDIQKEIELQFFPSPPDENKRNLEYKINNPQIQLSYIDQLGKKESKVIGLNEPIMINGRKVSMVDAKPWVELIIYKTPGYYHVYFSFALAILGLCLYYALPYHKITFDISFEGDIVGYSLAKLKTSDIDNRLTEVIKAVSRIIPEPLDNPNRREEEIW